MNFLPCSDTNWPFSEVYITAISEITHIYHTGTGGTLTVYMGALAKGVFIHQYYLIMCTLIGS